MKQEELNRILELHKKWLNNEDGGICAKLIVANLSGANLSGADLRGADLHGAYLSEATLSETDLSGADLRYANLSGANLNGADLSGADLREADLSCADLICANLSFADLSGANLSGADLSSSDLHKANLSGANLSYADLSYTNLSGADLSGADLSEADLYGLIINNKYQEALNYLRYSASESEYMKGVEEQNNISYDLLQELVDMYPFFRRLKSKEKPLSPMLNKDKELVCRHCEESSGLYSVHMETEVDYDYEENPDSYYYEVKEKNSYCGNCGQALDWSKE